MIPQMKDLVERYTPSIFFTDGEWCHPSDVFNSCEFLAWLFNESTSKDQIVVNDRWGNDTRSVHGGYFTTEYGEVGFGKKFTEGKVWEECRGIGKSFGYNRIEDPCDYMTGKDLIHLLVNVVSKGGNLLLNIGPTADGRIPIIMQERLLEIGQWLATNGEAIYQTKKWLDTSEDSHVRYTVKDDTLYATCLAWPGKELILNTPKPKKNLSVQLLGYPQQLQASFIDEKLKITIPDLNMDQLPASHAYVFKINGVK
jgi:alpha-L-fucosidase